VRLTNSHDKIPLLELCDVKCSDPAIIVKRPRVDLFEAFLQIEHRVLNLLN